MGTELEASAASLYNADYVQWIETTLAQLRSRHYGQIDWENLIEEVEDMGRSERRALASNLSPLFLKHVLTG